MHEIFIPSHTVPYSVAVILAISGNHHTRPSPNLDVLSKSVVSRNSFDTAHHGKPAVQYEYKIRVILSCLDKCRV